MKVKIKKLNPNAVIPQYAIDGDAGLDLTATEINFHPQNNVMPDIATIKCGLAIEIPEGFVGLLVPRSSIYKNNAILTNSIGIIDSNYRGEIMANFYTSKEDLKYKVGDRFAQLLIIPYPKIEFEEVEELSTSERGDGGFGSTNK